MQRKKHKITDKGLKINIHQTNYAGEIMATIEINGDEIIIIHDSDAVISTSDIEGNYAY